MPEILQWKIMDRTCPEGCEPPKDAVAHGRIRIFGILGIILQAQRAETRDYTCRKLCRELMPPKL